MRTLLVLLKMLISRSPGGGDGVMLRGGLTGHNNHNIPSTHSPAPGSWLLTPGSFTWHQVGTRRRLLSVRPQPFPLPHLPPWTDFIPIFTWFFSNFLHLLSDQLSQKICAFSIFDLKYYVLCASFTFPHPLFSAWPCSLCVSLASSS